MRKNVISYNETSAALKPSGRLSPDESKPSYLVHAVAKTLDVLDVLDQSTTPLGLAEITRRVGLPKSSILRLLRTLDSRGYVERRPDDARYQLGLKLFELGSQVARRFRVRDVAIPVMTRLRDQCDDTVNLAVLSGTDVVLIAVVESRQPLRMTWGLGQRSPAYCTALGKAMLACLSPSQLRSALPPDGLLAVTPQTFTDSSQLEWELERIRRDGFAIDKEENVPGARCVGAPIVGHEGHPLGAISVSGPAARLHDDRLSEVAHMVRAAAIEISHVLGYQGSEWLTLARECPTLVEKTE